MAGGGSEELAGLLEELPGDLRSRALTHSSWSGDRTSSYGRLAFLGDSVLSLAISAEVYARFPDFDAGPLTTTRAQIVRASSLRRLAEELGLPDLLAEQAPADGAGIAAETLLESARPLAEVTEAVIGACHLTHGFDATAAALVAVFSDQIDRAAGTREDYKSELQEKLAQTGATVSYEVTDEEGPAHDKRFEVAAMARGKRLGSGAGRSKKEAEQAAASEALERMSN